MRISDCGFKNTTIVFQSAIRNPKSAISYSVVSTRLDLYVLPVWRSVKST